MRIISTALATALIAAVGLMGCTKSTSSATGTQTAATKQAPATSEPAAEPAKAAAAANTEAAQAGAAPADESKAAAAPAVDGKAVLLKTSLGELTIELAPDKAPKSVANFLQYVKDGHFNGTIFHRVIDNFMIQGGGFDTSFSKKPTRDPVDNEADNGLKNTLGTVAMARTSDPHSASAQFFINTKDNAFLDFRNKTVRGWGYTVFGRISAGMDVVRKISKVQTGPKGPFGKDAPQQDVVIESATIVGTAK